MNSISFSFVELVGTSQFPAQLVEVGGKLEIVGQIVTAEHPAAFGQELEGHLAGMACGHLVDELVSQHGDERVEPGKMQVLEQHFVRLTDGFVIIHALKSNITLTTRLEGQDLGGAVNDLQREFKQQLHLPSGYSIFLGGAYSEQQQSFWKLVTILLLATLLVLTVLMFLLREWRVSFAVLFISRIGICGCLLALWITGVPLNVSSYTGIIMIVGILAENSIFTVWQYKTNCRNGGRWRNWWPMPSPYASVPN